MNNNELTLRIAEAIKPYRKRSERVIGYVPYTLDFEMRRYHGTSQKPEKISILEKTIVNLVGKGLSNVANIAIHLGLDMADEIEKDMVNASVEGLKTRLQLLQGKSASLSLTQAGREFITRGEYIKTFTRPFEIFVDVKNAYFPFLKDCVELIPKVALGKKGKKTENLSLSQIKFIAEQQASFVQYSENGLELISASLADVTDAKVSFYVCFIQSIRDNSVRTIIYDESSNRVIEQFSLLFDGNEKLRDSLLKQCLRNEVRDEDAVQVESGEKTEEQIVTESRIIEEADSKGEEFTEDPNSYESKLGSVYDSAEFEKELHEIFESHQNDEIWLISPWIRKYAFLRSREPMIRKFLDQGGAIFIGYSEPERAGEEMVDPDSMSVVKRLDANYDKFYYAELPKFHMKNVIEQKGNSTSLYTGSFNILSFCINGSDEHYRMEQMTFANRKEAKERRNGYMDLFATKYVEEYITKIKNSKNGTVNFAKLEYLKQIDALTTAIQKLEELAKLSEVKVESITRPNNEGMVALAQKVINAPYQEDSYQIQARLAALLFLFEYAKDKKNNKLLKDLDAEFQRLVNRSSIYRLCRFTMKKGREDSRKSIVHIICNGLNFEFGEILLPKNSFSAISKHKEMISFKEENIKYAKTNIGEILYNSAKSVGYLD